MYEVLRIRKKRYGVVQDRYFVRNVETDNLLLCHDGSVWVTDRKHIAESVASEATATQGKE